ncbi:YciI family protein [Dokdonella sp.]|uniref:YciI family protein n=1 Tax=Dokdonella sp. TaxID=2291710 RepID=UPI003783B8D8
MKFLMLVYTDDALLEALPDGEFDRLMHGCISHADELKDEGKLIESQQLEAASTAKSLRIRNGRASVVDGPFAETKEMLGGFNLIEAADMDEALRIAAEFPWAKYGCLELRPVRDFAKVRARVGA